MKRILSLIALLALVSALGMPVLAEDAASGSTDTPISTPAPDDNGSITLSLIHI
nr:hypothetical protein [uncultured Subdoligranulum sp.]